MALALPVRSIRTIQPVWVLVAAAIAVQIVYPLIPDGSRNGITMASVVVFFLASVADVIRVHGARGAVLLIAVAGGGGLLAESIGVATGWPFGPYTYADTLGPQILGVPAVIPLAWVMMAWPAEDLSGLPAAPPLNLLALVLRSKSLSPREMTNANPDTGRALLAYDRATTVAELDNVDAATFLDGLGMTERTRSMLFEAFARSFFCNQGELSAAELVAMFHYYFLGNPEGIGFDVPNTDHATAIWHPLQRYLEQRGGTVRLGTAVSGIAPDGQGWRVDTGDGALTTRHLVLALDPGALRALVTGSSATAASAPLLAAQCESLRVAPPFAVSRIWLDRDVAPGRAAFSAVSGQPNLDSIAVYSRLEDPSIQWARATGGSVIELHSYSCRLDDAADAAQAMRDELAVLWPETADAVVLHRHDRLEATAPAFPPGSSGTRPGVRTDARGLRLAGDYVELPFLAGLMERSAMSGVLAANDILAELGAAAEPIMGVPQRGLLAGVPQIPRRGRKKNQHIAQA